MPNNMNKYGFGNNQDTDNRDWYPTKQEPIKAKLYPYNHIDDLINEKLEQHIQRTDNPHQVTLQQLGVDHLFTHNMRVEYDEDKPIIHLILLDLNGNPLSDVGPIDIDVSEYSEEQLEELKRYLEEKINVIEEEIKEITDKLSIEELSKRTYTDLDNIEHTVVRIQLDEKESIYRDYDGNDVVKIVDNNVLLNGEPLSPNLTVNSDTIINKVLETNAEEVYDNKLNVLNLTIPSSAKHGFCSYISFEPASTFTFNVINESEYSLKIIMNGAKTTLSDIQFVDNCQYNLMFLCNGVNVELYIQEIQLV